ncbi:UNVERIFIED_CONTAM: hypothetical protein FKN15_059876 [Acipenser sinensis]
MADQEVSVREFVAVTDVDEERARFFLESAGWDLQLALASFFEDGADDDIVTLPPPEPSAVPRPTAPRFYAGGSERSGQQIVGPPKKKSSNEVVEDLFKGAKEHGAVPVDRASKGPGESSKGRVFGGGGYRLGATPEEQSAYVTAQKRSTEPAQDVHVVLKLWKSGFSLDDGELRNYSDPGNAQFLESIRRGEIPMELRRLSSSGQVNLDMEDHRDEDFSKPKTSFRAFTGEGQKLGSVAPQLVGAGSKSQQETDEAQASSSMAVNESEATTNIQIRLADGGRLVQRFNHTHSSPQPIGQNEDAVLLRSDVYSKAHTVRQTCFRIPVLITGFSGIPPYSEPAAPPSFPELPLPHSPGLPVLNSPCRSVPDCFSIRGCQVDQTVLVLWADVMATLSIPMWQFLLVKFGKKTTLFVGLSCFIPALISLASFKSSLALFFAMSAFAGSSLAVLYLLPWSMLPDVVDDFKVKNPTCTDLEPLFYSFYVFFNKFGGGVSLGISAMSLYFAGYKPGACSHKPAVITTLRVLFAPAPVVLLLLGMLIFYFYPINEERRREIKRELDKIQKREKETREDVNSAF